MGVTVKSSFIPDSRHYVVYHEVFDLQSGSYYRPSSYTFRDRLQGPLGCNALVVHDAALR